MQEIRLPGGELPYVLTVQWSMFPDGSGGLFWRDNRDESKTEIYLFDFQNLILYDFCYSIENNFFSDNATDVAISPDQRYVSFTNSISFPCNK